MEETSVIYFSSSLPYFSLSPFLSFSLTLAFSFTLAFSLSFSLSLPLFLSRLLTLCMHREKAMCEQSKKFLSASQGERPQDKPSLAP